MEDDNPTQNNLGNDERHEENQDFSAATGGDENAAPANVQQQNAQVPLAIFQQMMAMQAQSLQSLMAMQQAQLQGAPAAGAATPASDSADSDQKPPFLRPTMEKAASMDVWERGSNNRYRYEGLHDTLSGFIDFEKDFLDHDSCSPRMVKKWNELMGALRSKMEKTVAAEISVHGWGAFSAKKVTFSDPKDQKEYDEGIKACEKRSRAEGKQPFRQRGGRRTDRPPRFPAPQPLNSVQQYYPAFPQYQQNFPMGPFPPQAAGSRYHPYPSTSGAGARAKTLGPCLGCGKMGHWVRDCKTRNQQQAAE